MNKSHKIIYWTSTILLALGMFSGGLMQALKTKETAEGILHLGYPIYFLSVLGTWKVLGVIAILLPKRPLLKEWAYAGFFFAMTGASISHIIMRDSFVESIGSFIFILLIVLSWSFRPENRKLMLAKPKKYES